MRLFKSTNNNLESVSGIREVLRSRAPVGARDERSTVAFGHLGTMPLATGLLIAGMLLGGCGNGGGADDSGGSGGAASGGSDAGGSGGSTGGASTGGASTGGASTGGASTGGSSGGGTGGMPGGMGGLGGMGGDSLGCTAEFEPGPCEGAFPVYWHNPETGQCENMVWGGCGGNSNRYETLAECEETCGVEPTGASCVVNGITYPDGADGVPDPYSCNSCSCDDGTVGICTEAYCPDECPDDTAPGTECVSCGPADECQSVHTGCLPTCTSADDCDSGICDEGVCRNVCG